MSTRMTNLFLGVMAMSLGAAGGGIWASGEPVTPAPVEAAVVVETPTAVETPPVVDTATPVAKAETDVPACCRKGQGKCCKGKAADAAPAPAAKTAPAAAASESYVCPMHPEVTSSKKEDRCPKCGMFLEAAEK